MTELAAATQPSPRRSLVRSLLDRPVVRRVSRTLAPRAENGPQPGPVARQLSRLGPGWLVVDDVAAGRGRLDHLIVGPGGVFAVASQHDARETICLGGDSLLVAGQRVHHLRDCRTIAADVSERLTSAVGFSVSVTALVLIVGDRRFVVPSQADTATVRLATPSGSVRWMRQQAQQWTADGVQRIRAAAASGTTWSAR